MSSNKEILCFHEIGYQKNPYVIIPEDFDAILRENPKAEIHLDDGRRGIWLHAAAILKNLKRTATIFIVPNWVKNYNIPPNERYSGFLDFNEIEKLIKMGFEIGSHTVSHANLTVLPYITLMHELKFSKEFLESRFNVKVDKFSIPFGKTNFLIHSEASKIYKQVYALDHGLGIKRKMILAKS